ncbi:MAG: DUF2530 domain-containing protein [Actinomycetales bacterium]|nr:DUF2530 domain-containing protein [Tetrasphaera sp.]NLW98521.1 DUF2530 domain-containing protein [Actinomycetales bacterium]
MPEDHSATGRKHDPVTLDASQGPAYPPMPVKTVTVIKVGVVLWAIALIVTLVVPALHTGDRDWWPWTCVAGLVLGLVGYLYVRRGRGNAAGVE